MKLETQCPQSPDVNVLDIGVFNGLQAKSEEYRTDATGVSDLVKRIKKTFIMYPHEKLTNCFAVLLEHYRSILMCEGAVEINVMTLIVEFVGGYPDEDSIPATIVFILMMDMIRMMK